MADGDDLVRAQYDIYPYPARNPEDEAHRLITGSPSHILEIEHFIFAGGQAGDLRALIAGGGTGDGDVYRGRGFTDGQSKGYSYRDLGRSDDADHGRQIVGACV